MSASATQGGHNNNSNDNNRLSCFFVTVETAGRLQTAEHSRIIKGQSRISEII